MEIFKLFGSIFVNTDAADASMKKTEKGAESVAAKLGSGIKAAAKWGAAIVTGATVAAGAIMGLATDAAGAADEIDKMSQKIGISNEAYQEWSYVMGQNGMDVEKLSVGMKTLVAQMDMAASGTTSAQENFDKLGVSIYDTSGKLKDQETILNETMHALADMENGTEKSRLATELFGKAGIEMMPMLNQGSEAMDELTQRAHDLGLVMSDDAVSAGVTLGDTIDDIKQSFSMIGTQLGNAVIPIIQQFADIIIQNMPMIQQMIGQLGPILANAAAAFLPVLTELVQVLLPILLDLFAQIVPVIMNLASTILPILTNVLGILLPPMMKIIQTLMPALITVLTAVTPLLSLMAELLTPIIQLVTNLIVPLVELATSALTPLIEMLSALLADILTPLIPIIESVAAVVQGGLMSAFKGLEPVISNIQLVFGGLVTFLTGIFTGNWKKVFNGLKSIVSGAFNGIKTLINGLKNAFSAAWSAIKDVFAPVGEFFSGIWSGIQGAFSNVTSWFRDIFTKAWQGVKDVFSTGGKIFDGIKQGISDVFVTVVNGIIGGINKVIAIPFKAINTALNGIKKANILGIKPFSWIQTIPVPEIPTIETKSDEAEYYAEGGVMTEPTVFGYNPATQKRMVGGEAGAEAIAPISTLQSYIAEAVSAQNSAFVAEMSNIMTNHANILASALAQLEASGIVRLEDPSKMFKLMRNEKAKFEASTGGAW